MTHNGQPNGIWSNISPATRRCSMSTQHYISLADRSPSAAISLSSVRASAALPASNRILTHAELTMVGHWGHEAALATSVSPCPYRANEVMPHRTRYSNTPMILSIVTIGQNQPHWNSTSGEGKKNVCSGEYSYIYLIKKKYRKIALHA